MSGLMTREGVEQLRGFGQREREDQPVWLSGRERLLGGRGGGVSIVQGEVRDAREQMRLDEREGRAGRGRVSPNFPDSVQRGGGISLRHADHRTRAANGTHPTGFGGASG